MKRFYILANPNYFKKTMGWGMKHGEVKYTEDKLVVFVASDHVPDTAWPYHCGHCNTESNIEESFREIFKPYLEIIETKEQSDEISS